MLLGIDLTGKGMLQLNMKGKHALQVMLRRLCWSRCRVKGAVHMNLDVVRDTESDWPNTIPSREHFEKCIGDVSKVLIVIVLLRIWRVYENAVSGRAWNLEAFST